MITSIVQLVINEIIKINELLRNLTCKTWLSMYPKHLLNIPLDYSISSAVYLKYDTCPADSIT